jgi:predicted metal-binding membrane protein
MFKDSCLSLCRSPVSFINDQGGFRPSAKAVLELGLRHGLYCVGCCWALMAILFAVGVMELIWIAVISIWALLEKIFPVPGTMTQFSGVTLIVVGILLLARTAL